ncbi:ferritin-like domain-containing protein [Chitinophaga rhizophila]|uniref:Ferritin-like domain-containing protein n=1 Tax=Chitinophaga rhizophila TaxID=2866212 RepID=A0ABS7GGR5_9BACT|nr:ferritin-like domain-containing protein [Chitinophaga rhizophila]MBW8685979.1 ferritin-like domain-containing protein [Chitinophaga rhizophila]
MLIRKTRSVTSDGKEEGIAMPNVHRRAFLKYAGMGAAILTAGSIASCSSDEDGGMVDEGVSLGTGDVSVLNYAYALEQLEAAFYTQVVATPYSGISDVELTLLTDIRNHEIAHREFFKKALASGAIPNLTVDFSSINFSSRDAVLGAAKTFEDLGVAAYNGAGKFIKTAEYLVLAGKIVSVEARHAALIRDLISNGSFASDADAQGLDFVKTPQEVFAAAGAYIKTKVNTNTLPK